MPDDRMLLALEDMEAHLSTVISHGCASKQIHDVASFHMFESVAPIFRRDLIMFDLFRGKKFTLLENRKAIVKILKR